jgi:hypothetical protein
MNNASSAISPSLDLRDSDPNFAHPGGATSRESACLRLCDSPGRALDRNARPELGADEQVSQRASRRVDPVANAGHRCSASRPRQRSWAIRLLPPGPAAARQRPVSRGGSGQAAAASLRLPSGTTSGAVRGDVWPQRRSGSSPTGRRNPACHWRSNRMRRGDSTRGATRGTRPTFGGMRRANVARISAGPRAWNPLRDLPGDGQRRRA